MLTFPRRPEGTAYLTEGGTETELMYKFGHELPHFAIYPLLDDPAAVADLHGMYRRYLEVAERHGLAVMMGGLDYRASPDWAERLGYSRAGLAEMQHRAIDFLREAAAPFRARLPAVLVLGVVGPRGDAYGRGEAITATEAGAAAPDGYGINCSHPLEFAPALEPGDWIRRLRGLRPNAARMDKIALCKLGHLEEGDPPELGRLMGELARRYPHIDIWGGCCGSWETHLEEIARHLDDAPARHAGGAPA